MEFTAILSLNHSACSTFHKGVQDICFGNTCWSNSFLAAIHGYDVSVHVYFQQERVLLYYTIHLSIVLLYAWPCKHSHMLEHHAIQASLLLLLFITLQIKLNLKYFCLYIYKTKDSIIQ